jgi:dipeptidase
MNRIYKTSFSFLLLPLVFISFPAFPCTNFLVTKGASVNGSTMITYSADSHTLYGELYHWPASDYPEGSLLDVYEWDTGKFLGKIKQAKHTWSVVGNMNEHQLSIGETTFTGNESLIDTTGIIDYGSLIYITLQRAKNAREAILTISELVDTYGYYSSGESFSIADPNEVWILEIIGKGPGNKGAVWVARRIPDGYVSGHANQARIQTFPLSNGKTSVTSREIQKVFNPELECIYAYDVIEIARKNNLFSGKDAEFSFSDAYAPINFSGARFCEVRVWSFFNAVNKDMQKYFSYASGHDLSTRMPLWIKPDRKLSSRDMMNFMRDHLEGTPLDMRLDAGAGSFGLPYRLRPLTWNVSDDSTKIYCNERATATQQTGFSFIAECRNWLPDPIGGILWFGVDDAATSVYVPVYCGITSIPWCFRVGNGDMLTYSPTSAFWIFNFVSNFCYLRYDVMSADAIRKQDGLETKFALQTPAVDQAALLLYKKSEKEAREYLTDYTSSMSQLTFETWKELSHYLLVKYIDGNIKKEEKNTFSRNPYGLPVMPSQPGYSDKWKKAVILDTGDKLLVPEGEGH